jgi:hypothetical protein
LVADVILWVEELEVEELEVEELEWALGFHS